MSLLDVFAPAEAIADAVLYEGYVLYPYRASSDKNRIRWQWGVLGPVGAADDGVGEDAHMGVDLPVEHDGSTRLRLRLRGLQVVSRVVERSDGSGWTPVSSVTVGGETHVSFDEAVVRLVETELAVGDDAVDTTMDFDFGSQTDIDDLGRDGDGRDCRLVRHQQRITGTMRVSTEHASESLTIVHIDVRNTTPWPGGDRDAANLRSLVGTHLLAAAHGGLLVSTVDPPGEHAGAVAGCRSHRLWPVVVGAEQRATLVLAAPVILSDQPEIAPESHGSFYDGLEIDEMLSLRVMTMTDVEKAEARATDPRSAAIVDRVEAMSADDMAALHGAIRSLGGATPQDDPFDIPTIVGDGTAGETAEELTGGKPWWDPGVDERFDPHTDGVVVNGTAISRGSKVRIEPGRRADAHDIFYRDRIATVGAIVHDVDGSVHVAVTVDDDPAADLQDATGRYLYFSTDEVRPLGTRVER